MADQSGGIGFVGVLTILFIAFKLAGIITWSWVWVLSPIWIAALIVVGFLILALIGGLIALLVGSRRESKRIARRRRF